jgi:hypothetical protein
VLKAVLEGERAHPGPLARVGRRRGWPPFDHGLAVGRPCAVVESLRAGPLPKQPSSRPRSRHLEGPML